MASEELIREKMERTRESLTDKLEALENKLIGSVEEATSAVRETVEGATSAVRDTVSTVKETVKESVESVKEAVDVPAHVDRHPWFMFGGAVVSGYLLGNLLTSDRRIRPGGFTLTPPRYPPESSSSQNGQQNDAGEKPVRKDGLFAALGPEIEHLKGLALGVTLGAVREIVAKDAPPYLAEQLRAILDNVTKKMGGEPIAAEDLPFAKEAHEQSEKGSWCP